MQKPIYMDYHASTPVDLRVLEAMLPCFTQVYGNAASVNHPFGWQAQELVERGRAQVADIIGATPQEIVFTSGATESDNLALKGVFEANRKKGNHVITQVTEHKAILDTGSWLEKNGAQVTYLPVDRDGLVDVGRLEESITDRTVLVSIMAANNEIGVLQPLTEIGAVCRRRGVIFHTDAAQAVGKVPLDMDEMGIDLMSMSAHKMYGPKGVGALYVRKTPYVRLTTLIHGGGHERKLRSGTLNVPGIVGFGKACEIAKAEMGAEARRLVELRERLREGLMSQLTEVYVNGHPEKRLPGNLNLSFAFIEGESLILSLCGIAVSTGSACTSATLQPSHVLAALGQKDEMLHSSIRFGLGRFTTAEEVDIVIRKVVEQVNRLRELSPLWDMHRKGIDIGSIQWKDDHHH